jgi:hypothetical protein
MHYMFMTHKLRQKLIDRRETFNEKNNEVKK